ncbi:MAG: ABC transporter permease subunit [Streptosporangiales bacterium]|nr:ABC transporter permease subunit [Streptosporangiales bacterium]
MSTLTTTLPVLTTPAAGTFRRMLRNRRVVICGSILAVIGLAALFAPLLAPYDYRDPVGIPLSAGSSVGWIGTDDFGRDVLSRLIHGSRVSLGVSVVAVLIASTFGTLIGLVAGYFRGATETISMRGIDILLCFPPVVLAVAAVAALGPELRNVILIIGVLYIPRFARIVYGSVLSVSTMEYVIAARSMGSGALRILSRTVLPNVTAPILVQLSLSLGFAIQIESGLSFLGLGAQPPLPSWGSLVASGRDFLEVRPMLLIAPAVVIAVTVLALNILGDGLRDVFDPRRRH